jgi:uncharacterized repeat protein (TIGR01451 family)
MLAALFISASSASPFYGLRNVRGGSAPAHRAGKSATTSRKSASLPLANHKSIATNLFSTFLPQLPSAPDQVLTYAADCTTPKTAFELGDTVCASVIGNADLTNFPRRLALVDSAGYVRDVTAVATNPESISFVLPTDPTSSIGVETVDNRGGWRINSLPGGSNRVRASAFITVSDPANKIANLVVYKSGDGDGTVVAGSNITYGLWLTNRGPDAASNVVLADALPANTTFINGQQDDGPAFTCTFGAASTNCTIASLAAGETARFTLIYNVSGGAAIGTIISNTASITSTAAESNDLDNTETSTSTVIGGTPQTCTLECPNDVVVTADTTQGGIEGAVVNYGAPEGFGSCGAITSTPASGSFFPVGSTQVNSTSATGGGTCSFTIHVISGTPPSITCPSNKTSEATAGESEATVDVGTPTAAPDGVIVNGVRSDNRPVSDPYPIGVTTINWTASDLDGRTASCNQTITVTDAAPLTITCPADITVTAPTGTCEATVDPGTATAPAGATVVGVRSDNQPLSDPYPAGETRITWTATGADGRVASCVQFIRVNANDTTAPTLVVPPDVTITGASCSALVDDELGVATAEDNCTASVSIVRSGVPLVACPIPSNPGRQCESFVFPTGTTNVVYSATDAAGNTTTGVQHVTVLESTPPTITAPAAVSINTGPGATICGAFIGNATLGAATANDNCPGVTVARTGVPSGNIFPVGTTVVTYTATDASGNTANATQNVTVTDTTVPTITAPANVTLYNGPGATSCGVTVSDLNAALGTATANDNCPGVTVARGGGNVFPLGNTTVTYTATDAYGNSAQANQTVTVVDNTAPVISCPANITVNLPLNSTATSMAVSYPAATATDNCGGTITFNYSKASGSVFPVGPTTVTATATDSHGNSASCTFTVTVLYNFTGFFSPVNNIPTLNSVNAGAAVPIKFSLSGNKGLNIFAANNPYSVSLNCSSSDPGVDITETVNAGGSSLSFGGDQYNYVWKTSSSWAGTCRQLVVTLNDGSVHVANFKFK